MTEIRKAVGYDKGGGTFTRIELTVKATPEMTEIRCKKCNRLLMKVTLVDGEIKCPKCGYSQIIHHCPQCGIGWHEVKVDVDTKGEIFNVASNLERFDRQ